MIRYCDDFVICTQYRSDAVGLLAGVKARLAKFGLEVAAEKTRIVEFGRFAQANAENQGGKPATFDFLGFTHYCSKTSGRQGTTDSRQEFPKAAGEAVTFAPEAARQTQSQPAPAQLTPKDPFDAQAPPDSAQAAETWLAAD